MLCVIFSTALWLVVATKLHMPVSTTQATVGGIIGIALVARGGRAVQWSGVGLIVASWFVSPILSALLSGAIFWGVRKFVLRSPRPFDNALLSLPFLVGFTLAVNIFFIVYEGPEALSETPLWAALVAAVGGGLLTGIVVYFFVVPRVRRSVKSDVRAGLVPGHAGDAPQGAEGGEGQGSAAAGGSDVIVEMPQLSAGHDGSPKPSKPPASSDSSQGPAHNRQSEGGGADSDSGTPPSSANGSPAEGPPASTAVDSGCEAVLQSEHRPADDDAESVSSLKHEAGQAVNSGWATRLTAGMSQDVHADTAVDGGDATVAAIHSQGEVFEPRTERVFTYLQVVTACFDSFGHGANDVANSIGPLAAIVAIYETSSVSSDATVPLWVLALGGVGIVVGLATLGYEIIKAIGVRLSKITPSRGFTIEIGAAFVIVVGSRLGLPLSTTQAQIGSTVGVALLEGRRGAVNWPALARVFLGWVLTLVVTGTVSASVFAFCVYAPSVPSGPLYPSSLVQGGNMTASA